MQLLHLTDLHAEAGTTDFDALWSGVETSIPNEVDFVVISGDIASAAAQGDYQVALKFIRKRLFRLVGERQERIIIVPGNHDIDWSCAPGRPLDGSSEMDKGRRDFERSLEASAYRFDPDAPDKPGAGYEITGAAYNQRFANYQAFVDEWYEDRLGSPHRHQQLTAPSHESHWSAHVFPEQDVSFYGLSTCSHTDRCARGARLTAAPLQSVARHMRTHRTRINVAVWHHGLTAERGARDFLTTEELGLIFNSGFALGIHGHTHADEQTNLWSHFRSHFPVIATGSFGADAAHLPQGKSNQFSLIEIDGARVSWQTFSLEKQVAQWRAIQRLEQSYPLRTSGVLRAPARVTRARSHTRTLTLSSMGVATLVVKLEGLKQVGRLPLARLSPGYTNCEWESIEVKRNGRVLINGAEVHEDAGQFWLDDTHGNQGYDEVTWTCHFSNGHALNATDTSFGLQRAPMKLRSHQDAVLYEIPFETSFFSLRLELPHAVIDGTASAVAQEEDAAAGWRHMDDTGVLEGSPDVADQRSIELRVRHPITGCRYGFHYRLSNKRQRPALTAGVLGCLDNVLKLCRTPEWKGRDSSRGKGKRALSERLRKGIVALFQQELGLQGSGQDEVLLVGRLWSQRAKRLLTAFGNFPPATWGTSFAYGTGLAGHCFRFGQLVAWQQVDADAERDARLIHQMPLDDGEDLERPWIIEMPLFLDRDKVPIGTIGLAGPFAALDGLVSKITRGDDDATAQKRTLNQLSDLASVIFWKTTAEVDHLAKELYAQHWASKEPANGSPAKTPKKPAVVGRRPPSLPPLPSPDGVLDSPGLGAGTELAE
jgi:hypothetical protein